MKSKLRFTLGRRAPLGVTLAAMALGLTACGGSDSGSGGPTISTLMSQSTNQDTPTMAQSFTVNDSNNLNGLTLSVGSSDTTVVPADNIVLSGSGATRSVVVTPREDATGVAVISINAMDAQGRTAQAAFRVTVNAVTASFKDLAFTAYGKQSNDMAVDVRGKTYTQDADDPTTFAALLQ